MKYKVWLGREDIGGIVGKLYRMGYTILGVDIVNPHYLLLSALPEEIIPKKAIFIEKIEYSENRPKLSPRPDLDASHSLFNTLKSKNYMLTLIMNNTI